MRCCACNVLLNDVERTRKGNNSDEYLDMCSNCCGEAGIIGNDREDLLSVADEYVVVVEYPAVVLDDSDFIDTADSD